MIFDRIAIDASGCWLWTRGVNQAGYGYHSVPTGHQGSRTIGAHRYVYEALVGPIPDGLVLDHLCRVRHCVNPAHLEPVTNAENIRRGETGLALANAKRALTHCKRGHEFTPENTQWRQGRWRVCRTCARARNRSWRASLTA